jgi:hypothetical protein
VGCGSDNNSTVLQFGCNDQVGTNLTNPLSPSAGVTYGNSVNVPGVAGAQTGCAYGYNLGANGISCGPGGVTRQSDWCSEGGYDVPLLASPAVVGLEVGPSWVATCYATNPKGNNSSEATGGELAAWAPTTNGNNSACWTDGNAQVQLTCSQSTVTPVSNPTNGVAGYGLSGQVTALGTPIPIPATSAQAGTGCANGTIAVSTSSCANGGLLGASGQGSAAGSGYSYLGVSVNGVAASGTNSATAGALAVSGTGCTGGNNPTTGISVSATNCAWGGLAGISGLGSSGGTVLSVGGSGCSYGQYVQINTTGCTSGQLLGASGTNNANSSGYSIANGVNPAVAVSGQGCATSPVTWYSVVVSGTGCANAPTGLLGISGTGTSYSGIGISGTNNTGTGGTGNGIAAISGTGCATGSYLYLTVAVSGTGCANSGFLSVSGVGAATCQCSAGGAAISGGNDAAASLVSISGLGSASSNGYGIYPGVAVAGGTANARDAAVSGTGNATGSQAAVSGLGSASASTLAVSGGDGAATVAGTPVSPSAMIQQCVYQTDPTGKEWEACGPAIPAVPGVNPPAPELPTCGPIGIPTTCTIVFSTNVFSTTPDCGGPCAQAPACGDVVSTAICLEQQAESKAYEAISTATASVVCALTPGCVIAMGAQFGSLRNDYIWFGSGTHKYGYVDNNNHFEYVGTIGTTAKISLNGHQSQWTQTSNVSDGPQIGTSHEWNCWQDNGRYPNSPCDGYGGWKSTPYANYQTGTLTTTDNSGYHNENLETYGYDMRWDWYAQGRSGRWRTDEFSSWTFQCRNVNPPCRFHW